MDLADDHDLVAREGAHDKRLRLFALVRQELHEGLEMGARISGRQVRRRLLFDILAALREGGPRPAQCRRPALAPVPPFAVLEDEVAYLIVRPNAAGGSLGNHHGVSLAKDPYLHNAGVEIFLLIFRRDISLKARRRRQDIRQLLDTDPPPYVLVAIGLRTVGRRVRRFRRREIIPRRKVANLPIDLIDTNIRVRGRRSRSNQPGRDHVEAERKQHGQTEDHRRNAVNNILAPHFYLSVVNYLSSPQSEQRGSSVSPKQGSDDTQEVRRHLNRSFCVLLRYVDCDSIVAHVAQLKEPVQLFALLLVQPARLD